MIPSQKDIDNLRVGDRLILYATDINGERDSVAGTIIRVDNEIPGHPSPPPGVNRFPLFESEDERPWLYSLDGEPLLFSYLYVQEGRDFAFF